MPKKTTKTYKPTPQEATALKKQFADDKKAGLAFKDALATMNQDRPDEEKLTESYAYNNLWPKGKQGAANPVAPKKTANGGGAAKPFNVERSEEDPSTRLATLLKKEGMLKGQLTKVQEELKAVSEEIDSLWAARSK